MKKYIWIPLVLLILVLLAGIGFLGYSFFKEREANEAMQELAALDKQEMENEYERFALQYSEMMTQINNDSILAQLTKEQMRTQELLAELKQVKDDDAKEIARLKRELATVRAVLRDYVMQIDSLNRQNQELIAENTRMQGEMDEASRTIEDLNTERETLSERVAMAAQLDAHAITMTPLKKNGKSAKKMKDCKNIAISFNIARNVTAENGQRTVYVRITTPTGEALNGGGTITYENRTIEYSIKKVIEYTGEETPVTLYWNVAEYLGAGSYNVSVFADGNMIGSRNFTFN